MSTDEKVYTIVVAGVRRELPLMEVKPGLRIAVLNILGDTEIAQAAATELAHKLDDVDYSVLVTAEAKSFKYTLYFMILAFTKYNFPINKTLFFTQS